MTDPRYVPLIFFVFAILAVLGFCWHTARSGNLLDTWASANGLTILNSERRILRKGPFTLTSGKGQDVYYVTVRDQSGKEKSGYVRCGSLLVGLLSDKVEVRWDE